MIFLHIILYILFLMHFLMSFLLQKCRTDVANGIKNLIDYNRNSLIIKGNF